MHRGRPAWIVLGIGFLLLISIVAGVLVVGRGGKSSGSPRPLAVLRTADYHSLAFSPDDPNVVFFGHHNGVMRSDDGGKTWRRLVERRNFDAMALAIAGGDSRLVYLAGHDVFYVSHDGGVSWRPVEHNLPGTDIHGFTISPETHGLYAFVVGHGLFHSSDGGRIWAMVSTQLPTDVVDIAANGGNPELLYAVSLRMGVLRSTDGGQHWVPVSALGSGAVAAVEVDLRAPKTVYAGGQSGLYTSTDAGDSWTRLAFPRNSVTVLASSPSQPGLLLAIVAHGDEGFVYRSEDGGRTWER
ncbi:MAG: hypothetical protein HY667_00920 [Chloroflexi bacterium]|nr:hypothetical protein [Chloroflexota bacterium]